MREKMPAVLESAAHGMGKLVGEMNEMVERHHVVVSTVVKVDARDRAEICFKAGFQDVFVYLPPLPAEKYGSYEEQPDDVFFADLFGKEFKQNRSTERMPDQNHLIVKRRQFAVDGEFPQFILRIVGLGHSGIQYDVLFAKASSQMPHKIVTPFVGALWSAAMNK
jgi:hypothetical protein